MVNRILLLLLCCFLVLVPVFACAPATPATFKIGCVWSVSGPLGPNGITMLSAARLAVNEINAKGGVLGKQLELIEVDDATDANKSLEQVKKLLSQHRVQVFLGGMSIGAALASGPYLAEKAVPMVSPSATSSDISTQPWKKWLFRTVPSDALQGRVLASIILEKGYKRVASLVQAGPYGTGLDKALDDGLRRLGWQGKHVVTIQFDPNKKDYRTDMLNIERSNPDVIVAVTYVEDGIRIFKQASEMGLDKFPWIGCDGNYGDSMFTDPECAKFMEKAIVAGTRYATPRSADFDSFARAYRAMTGKDVGIYCDTTYDAVDLIARALEKARSYDGQKLRATLFEVGRNYQGVSGDITFDENGDRVTAAYEIWKVGRFAAAPSGFRNVQMELYYLSQ